MISTATKTLQANNKTIYVALLSTLTFFLFLDYIPGLQAWSAWVTPPVALFLGLIFALTCGQHDIAVRFLQLRIESVKYSFPFVCHTV